MPVKDTWSYIPGKNDAEGAPGWGLTWACFFFLRFIITGLFFIIGREELFLQVGFSPPRNKKNHAIVVSTSKVLSN